MSDRPADAGRPDTPRPDSAKRMRGRAKPGQRPNRPHNARDAAFRALIEFERGRAQRIDSALQTEGLDRRDADLALELARGVLRQLGFLDAVLATFASRGLPEDPRPRTALRLGAYQLLCLERVPPHAAVGESVALLRHAKSQKSFANAVLRRLAGCVQTFDSAPGSAPTAETSHRIALQPAGVAGRWLILAPEGPGFPDPLEDPLGFAAMRYSVPRFVLDTWAEAYGIEPAVEQARRSIATPGVALRVHVGRTNRDSLRADLAAVEVETADLEPAGGLHPRPEDPRIGAQMLRWVGGRAPFGVEPFVSGQCSVQDPTAFGAALAVDPRPGDHVFDFCSAPGGKATALAERLGANGRVFAFDIDPDRRKLVREAARRLGLTDRLIVLDTLEQLPPVDHSLVDVPCSNTGVMARRVEVRHRLHPGLFAELAQLQLELLVKAIRRTRPGGRIVYSTCSIDPTENQNVVEQAVRTQTVTLAREHLTLPNPPHHDGGYFAVLVRDALPPPEPPPESSPQK